MAIVVDEGRHRTPRRRRTDVGNIPESEAVFVAKAAHELRGAVGPIELLASALADRFEGGDDYELAAMLRQLSGQTARVNTMAHQLLDLTRFGPNRIELQATPITVAELIREVLAAEFPEFSPVIEIQVDDDLCIQSDPLALEQILSNLVRNAYRHGGDHVEVEVATCGERLVVQVRDDGPGVPEHIRPRLFEPFSRGSATGTGLGLAIVAELVHKLHGEITYEPNEPDGSRFSVIVPLG